LYHRLKRGIFLKKEQRRNKRHYEGDNEGVNGKKKVKRTGQTVRRKSDKNRRTEKVFQQEDYSVPIPEEKGEIYAPIEAEWFQKICQEIAPARRKKYLSQRQLAGFLKTGQSAISRLETGKANPTAEFLDRLFRVLESRLKLN